MGDHNEAHACVCWHVGEQLFQCLESPADAPIPTMGNASLSAELRFAGLMGGADSIVLFFCAFVGGAVFFAFSAISAWHAKFVSLSRSRA
jgi:hypothetical protein